MCQIRYANFTTLLIALNQDFQLPFARRSLESLIIAFRLIKITPDGGVMFHTLPVTVCTVVTTFRDRPDTR